MTNKDNLKKWEVIKRDGTTCTVSTYTEDAQVFNADGSPAKLVFPKPEPKTRKKKQESE
jgi:hypothetical protein